jgi:Alcohol dehydrogenase GroES-associated
MTALGIGGSYAGRLQEVRALVWHGPREMSVDDVPDPAPAAGEVLLEPVQPLDPGPGAFAELAAGPSERLKVFLA